MKKLITIISILLIATASYAEKAYMSNVKNVINCNTIGLVNGKEVRLIGIECPEDGKMRQEATEFVKTLIKSGQEIRLEFDVQEKDKYGRLLAYVWFDSPRLLDRYTNNVTEECEYKVFELKEEGTETEKLVAQYAITYTYEIESGCQYSVAQLMINALTIKGGYATPMTIPPNVKYAEVFEKLYKEAQEQERGLWGSNDEKIKNQRAIEEALKEQINKRKASGTQMGRMLYKKETKNAARLVYSAINTKLDERFMGTNKWLEGYTVRKNFGQWMYVGGQSKTYLSEKDLEEMKRWADKILKWK